ncbi:hypothetical protein HELRODRAFT_194149 [Helobdella robusta]|uniref:Tetraspanin n=1 Tax=Helobdella robusta TaxID=6412 RepID=T1FVR6_HELRO|nr:hypothetical protein HELRODRAFT_194149 [Helobdella robusta]ESN93220.1 hypothetical protein HELRODRAFT_194149 [Helobdella robusta]
MPTIYNNLFQWSHPILIILNLLGLIAGLTFLGASLFLLVDKGDLLTGVMFLKLAQPACILLIASSVASICITSLGLIGVVKNNIWVLSIYAVVIVLIGLTALIGAVFAIINIVNYTDWIRDSMRESLNQRYGVDVGNNTRNTLETYIWDVAQQKWYCCGVEDNSWGVYRSSAWYDRQPGTKEYDRPLVPPSCCVTDQYGQVINQQKCQIWQAGPPKLVSGQFNEALFYSGCYTFGLTVLNRVSRGIIVMGFILGIIEIVTVFCTVLIIISIKRSKKTTYEKSDPFTPIHS